MLTRALALPVLLFFGLCWWAPAGTLQAGPRLARLARCGGAERARASLESLLGGCRVRQQGVHALGASYACAQRWRGLAAAPPELPQSVLVGARGTHRGTFLAGIILMQLHCAADSGDGSNGTMGLGGAWGERGSGQAASRPSGR